MKDTLRLQTHEPQLSSVKPVMQPAPITPQPEPSLILTASTPTVTTTTVTTAATVPTTSTPNLPPRPQFAYEDINTNNFATLANQIHMSGQVGSPRLKPGPEK